MCASLQGGMVWIPRVKSLSLCLSLHSYLSFKYACTGQRMDPKGAVHPPNMPCPCPTSTLWQDTNTNTSTKQMQIRMQIQIQWCSRSPLPLPAVFSVTRYKYKKIQIQKIYKYEYKSAVDPPNMPCLLKVFFVTRYKIDLTQIDMEKRLRPLNKPYSSAIHLLTRPKYF